MIILTLLFNLLVYAETPKGPCAFYDKYIKAGVPEEPLKQALSFYQKNPSNFNPKNILIADYSMNSSKKRFFILNLTTGEVIALRVSHGSGKITLYKEAPTHEERMYVERFNGEPSHNGDFNKCRIPEEDLIRINKNRAAFGFPPKHNQENLTRAGFFKVGNLYLSAHHRKENRPKGRHHWWDITENHNGIRLHGLSPEVNDKALEHGIVMHEATYNTKHAPIMGRSYGCPAFSKGVLKKHLEYFKHNTLYYAYVPQCPEEMNKVLEPIPDYKSTCQSQQEVSLNSKKDGL